MSSMYLTVENEKQFSELPSVFSQFYAKASAQDWHDGFMNGLQPGKALELEEYLTKLETPNTNENQDFINRIGKSLVGGTLATFVHNQSVALKLNESSVTGVMRGCLYRPRYNKFKKPYAYIPDFLVNPNGDEANGIKLLSAAHNLLNRERVVVDSFRDSTEHQAMLKNLGFVSLCEQTWQTPNTLAEIIGPTYPVIQFVHNG